MCAVFPVVKQDQAPQHGSKLVLLLGNHELMNLQGDFRLCSRVCGPESEWEINAREAFCAAALICFTLHG